MNSQETKEALAEPRVPTLMELLRENAPNILGLFLCYSLGAVMGYIMPELVNTAVLADLMEALENTQKEFEGRPVEMALSNFGNSVVVVYFAMVLGIMAGVPPVYLMLSEGIFQGSMAAHEGLAWWRAFPTDLPSVIDLYAACIALGWGMKIGLSLFSPPRLLRIKLAYIEAHRVFFRLTILLLLIAAAVKIAGIML